MRWRLQRCRIATRDLHPQVPPREPRAGHGGGMLGAAVRAGGDLLVCLRGLLRRPQVPISLFDLHQQPRPSVTLATFRVGIYSCGRHDDSVSA